MNTLQSQWEKFESMCLQNVSDQQRREARISFYAGMASLIFLQSKLASVMDEKEALKIAGIWRKELEIFQDEQLANAANCRVAH